MHRLRAGSRRILRTAIIAINIVVPFQAIAIATTGHWGLAVMLVFSAHALWMIPTLWPACQWCGEVVTKLPQAQPDAPADAVWLTIDDGPDPVDTPQILDLLDRHRARATFFFIGAKAARHPNLVREVVARGHTVGNHTQDHDQFWFWAYGPRAIRRQIEECQAILTDLAGTAPLWFRAPAGLKSPLTSGAVERSGLRLACWSARGLDGVSRDPERVLARLRRAVAPGAIVLVHEGREAIDGARLGPRVVGDLLVHLDERGLRCVVPQPAESA